MSESSQPIRDTIFRVIDTETTGREPSTAKVCEFAYVDIFDGEEIGSFEHLVNPGIPIPPEISAVHHITDEMVADDKPIEAYRGMILNWNPVLVAHNAPYDSAVLGLQDRLWVDTERLAKHLWPWIRSHGNQEVRYSLKLKVENVHGRGATHTAMFDARTTAAILVRALEEIKKVWPHITTVGELISQIAKPVLLQIVPFKSANGATFEEADIGLLEWIVNKGAGGPDVVHSAYYWLEKRSVRNAIAGDENDPDYFPF